MNSIRQFQKSLLVAIVVLAGLIGLRHIQVPWTISLPQPAGEELLSGFETVKPWGTDPEQGFALKVSEEYVAQGEHSLVVTFPTSEYPSINTTRLKHGWGRYDFLAMDIFNPQGEKVDFHIRLDDAFRRVTIPNPLSPGWNHVQIPRSRIAGRIDAGKVQFVVLFIMGPQKDYTLYFDNLRLVRLGTKLISKEGASTTAGLEFSGQKPLPTRKAADLPSVPPVTQGSIKIALAKIQQISDRPLLISGGVPFAPGQLLDEKQVALFDKNNLEIPVAVKVLARWPQDHSVRSVLVQFPYEIPNVYQYVTMKWGVPRATTDLTIVDPRWDNPEGMILLSGEWLCASQVIGEQVPMGQAVIPKYDQRIEDFFKTVQDTAWTGDVRTDGYYSTPHVFYQFFVRSGELNYYLAARKELLHYRDQELVTEGPERGRSKVNSNPRYMYLDALADDYLLTGDPRSLEAAGYMAEFLKNNFKPQDAYFKKDEKRFWTERNYAFPLLDLATYYELTGDPESLKLAEEYVQNLYKTQMEWPGRGGFIHNLYAHDPEEGARPDEYGGSPFMTGLLLEGLIKSHQLTHSDTAADSIFRALEWLMNEGLIASGDTFKYLTADKYLDSDGAADLNLLIVHGFGYGYRMSGYQDKRYLDVGMKVFARGVKDGFVGRRKHFNQNYRSSGHFLAYIREGANPATGGTKIVAQEGAAVSSVPDETALYFEPFEFSLGRFTGAVDTKLEIDSGAGSGHGHALRAESKISSSDFSFGAEMDSWDITENPAVSFIYRIPVGTPLGMQVRTEFGDWICLGGTANYQCPETVSPASTALVDDGQWHELRVDAGAAVLRVLPKIKNCAGFQFGTKGNSRQGDQVWVDEFRIER